MDGLRADLALHKTARARAAFENRNQVTLDDVRAAAELVLPHRQRRRPFAQPHLDRERLEQRLDEFQQQHGSGPDAASRPTSEKTNGETGEEAADQMFEGTTPSARRIELAPGDPCAMRGRRNPAPAGERGRFVRAVPDEKATDVAIGATVLAAAVRGGWTEGKLQIATTDLHRKVRSGARERSCCSSSTPPGRWRRGGAWSW